MDYTFRIRVTLSCFYLNRIELVNTGFRLGLHGVNLTFIVALPIFGASISCINSKAILILSKMELRFVTSMRAIAKSYACLEQLHTM